MSLKSAFGGSPKPAEAPPPEPPKKSSAPEFVEREQSSKDNIRARRKKPVSTTQGATALTQATDTVKTLLGD